VARVVPHHTTSGPPAASVCGPPAPAPPPTASALAPISQAAAAGAPGNEDTRSLRHLLLDMPGIRLLSRRLELGAAAVGAVSDWTARDVVAPRLCATCPRTGCANGFRCMQKHFANFLVDAPSEEALCCGPASTDTDAACGRQLRIASSRRRTQGAPREKSCAACRGPRTTARHGNRSCITNEK